MKLVVRGALWIGIFVGVCLAPLVVAAIAVARSPNDTRYECGYRSCSESFRDAHNRLISPGSGGR